MSTQKFVIDPPAQAAIAVEGTDAMFPVRRIWCVGRNYADHAREMGHDPNREPPFFFAKPSDAVIPNHATIAYPVQTKDLHHEIELVVCIGKGGRDIPVAKALEHVYGYAVGLDMTRRDLQMEMRKMGRPWEIGKAFDRSAPIGPLVPAAEVAGDVHHADMQFGEQRPEAVGASFGCIAPRVRHAAGGELVKGVQGGRWTSVDSTNVAIA
mgnify:CR=1 FL=1